MGLKKPMLCLHAVTDEEGRPLDDENEPGMRLCTYGCMIFEARTEDERHHAYEAFLGFVQKAQRTSNGRLTSKNLMSYM